MHDRDQAKCMGEGELCCNKRYSDSNAFKVIHKENSTFLNRVFPNPYLYHELNMIIHTKYINM